MHIIAQGIDIHSFAVLINTKTKASANLLPLADVAAALFQRANLEHIRVIPTFTKGRVGEDEANRGTLRIPIQQKLFVLHDQVVCVNIIRRGFLLTQLGVD